MGFTLVELMVVVVIMGVLATIGFQSFRSQMSYAKTGEAKAMIQSISAAQESYRTHYPNYLDVSASLTDYYPSATLGRIIRPFKGWDSHADYEKWVRLAPTAPINVSYGYATIAGAPFVRPLPLTEVKASAADPWPAAADITKPWYVVQAAGDIDGDGEQQILVKSSFSNSVYIEGKEQ